MTTRNGRHLLTDDVVWELPYAPSIGHPARLSGRDEVVRFATWFVGAVGKFRFFDLRVFAFVFLRTTGGKIAYIREYFDPIRAAKAMDAPIPERRGG